MFILYRNANKLIFFFLKIKRDECFNVFATLFNLQMTKKNIKKNKIFAKLNYLRNATLRTRI